MQCRRTELMFSVIGAAKEEAIHKEEGILPGERDAL
jgi:hypothetical protein